MRRILDDLEARAAGKGQYIGHVAGEAAEVDRNDRLATRRQTTSSVIKVDATSTPFNVSQYHLRAEVTDDGRRRREGQRRHYNLVTRTDSACLGSKMQSRSRRIHRDSFDTPAHESSEFRFELTCFGTGRQPARSQY